MLREKILNGEELTYDEVQCIVWEDIEDEEEIITKTTINGDDNRWDRFVFTILEVDNRYFQLYHLQGLTEYQENTYEAQIALEVEPIEVVVTEWKPKENKNEF